MEFTVKYVKLVLDNIKEKREHALEKTRSHELDIFEFGFYNGVLDTCDEVLRQFEEA